MRYEHVCVEAFGCTLPPHIVTSTDIEEQLQSVYSRLGLPAGRLELMTGIQERRFFAPGTRPGDISSITTAKVLEQSGLPVNKVGALIHGSVCRDQMEPATAARVHFNAGLPQNCLVIDVSNACLGLLNGMLMIADMIELGRIQAGIVVGTEIARPLVEGTIDSLLHDESLTRKSIKPAIASLTIGSASAAIVLCSDSLSRARHRLRGATVLADTTAHELCAGGNESEWSNDARPRMNTDSEALLHAGINLAGRCWEQFLEDVNWLPDDVDKVFTHQVGKAHRTLLLDRLGIAAEKDFPTVDKLGNTGSAALPTAAALGIQQGHLQSGDNVALLGIGSGLNSVMIGIEW